MFDKFRLKDVLAHYKQNFVSTQWGNEKCKWEAVKWFQDNWDVNAQNFPEMLNRSLDKTFNLLASSNNFPKGMIVGFAKAAPEEVRAMFIALFDESKDVYERMNAFKLQSSILLEKYGNGAAQHYQYENAISTYLWLRYPDKYYIYKFGEVKTVANELEAEYHFKKGAYADNIRNFLKLYDEISLAIKEDKELVNLFQSQMTDTCYPDPELKTLTIDVGFYISRFYAQKDSEIQAESEWFPATYTPGFSEDDWVKLLGNPEIFTTGSLEIMKRMKDYGGQATCTQLAVKYGESKNFYSAGSSALARRIADKTGCPVMEEDTENTKWWPILYVGRYASKEEQGSYTWRLRDELSAALDKIDLSGIELYVKAAPGEEDHGYWWLNANPKIWSFSDIAVGEVQSYTLYNENGNKRRIFQNFLDAKAGDMIIGYESNPAKQIVAIGRISAEQDGEKLLFEKVEGAQYSPVAHLLAERGKRFQKITLGKFEEVLFMEEGGDFAHLAADVRIMRGELCVRAARVGEDEAVAFGRGNGRDKGFARGKVDLIQPAEGDARLIQKPAGLAEVVVFRDHARARLFDGGKPSPEIEHVDDLRDEHFERRRRGDARPAEDIAVRDAGKAAEGKPEPFQIAEHSPHKSDGLALFALAHGKFMDGKADGIVRARRDDDIAVAARRDRRHDVAGDRGN